MDITRSPKRLFPRKGVIGAIGLGVPLLVAAPLWLGCHLQPAAPTVSLGDPIWVDTVRRGSMLVDVHGVGKLIRTQNSAAWMAWVGVPADRRSELRVGQECDVDTRSQWITGHVQEIGELAKDNQIDVGIALDAAPLASRGGPDDRIDATIKIKILENVLYVGRPMQSQPYSSSSVFKLNPRATEALKVPVAFGAIGTNTIEIVSGLKEGDRIILLDMSQWDAVERVKIR
jgi:hypothetical protein